MSSQKKSGCFPRVLSLAVLLVLAGWAIRTCSVDNKSTENPRIASHTPPAEPAKPTPTPTARPATKSAPTTAAQKPDPYAQAVNELSALARGRSDLQAKLAAAQLELQKAKQAFVAGLPQSPEYQQRTKNLDAAIAAVETAQAAKDAKEMVRTATEKLDAQTDLNAITKRLEAADQGIINAAREIESLNQRLRKLTATEAKKQTELAAMEAQKLAEYWASEHGQTELLTRQVAAEQVSKEYILKFLKHPDDATFGFWDVPDIRSNSDRDVFYVSSKVKAKNDFGGELTYRWATIVFRNGDRWELVSCIIDNKSVYESEDLRSQLQKRAARK